MSEDLDSQIADFFREESRREPMELAAALSVEITFNEQRRVGQVLLALAEATDHLSLGASEAAAADLAHRGSFFRAQRLRYADGTHFWSEIHTPFHALLSEAEGALGTYELLSMSKRDIDSPISDEELDHSLASLFELIEYHKADPELWLTATRLLMPKAAVLGDADTPLDKVTERLRDIWMDYELQEMQNESTRLEVKTAVLMAVHAFVPGPHDAKADLIGYLSFRVNAIVTGISALEDFDPKESPAKGISNEDFQGMLRHALYLYERMKEAK